MFGKTHKSHSQFSVISIVERACGEVIYRWQPNLQTLMAHYNGYTFFKDSFKFLHVPLYIPSVNFTNDDALRFFSELSVPFS